MQRLLIMGNSGSGKSWLAARLSARLHLPVTDLDALNWESGGYSRARPKAEVLCDVHQIAHQERWIMEGVYGWIAESVALYATRVIWLTPDSAECVENIRARGISNQGSAEDFAALLEWAALYDKRTGSSSYQGHFAVFSQLSPDRRIRLNSREETDRFLALL